MDTVWSFFNGEFTQHDGQILIAIQDFLIHDAWTPVVKFITTLGNGGFIWIILTVLYCCSVRPAKSG